VVDSDYFSFAKQSGTDGGPYVWDASCTGEPFSSDESPPLSRGDGGDKMSGSGTTPTTKSTPNPFNLTTTLSYELRASSFVNLKVYDTTGRLVAILADGRREAGTHQVTFDGSGLASGIYLYVLNSADQTITGKMTLLK
jgi:hypothetical protein